MTQKNLLLSAVALLIALTVAVLLMLNKAPEPSTPVQVSCVPAHVLNNQQAMQQQNITHWESQPINQASILVAKRMAAEAWDAYQTLPELKAAYNLAFMQAQVVSAASPCNGEAQQEKMQEMNVAYNAIIAVFDTIERADNRRRY